MKTSAKKPTGSTLRLILIIVGIILTLACAGLLLMPQPQYKIGLENLQAVEKLASQETEEFKIDGENTIKPDFSTYFNSIKSTFMSKLKEKLVWF